MSGGPVMILAEDWARIMFFGGLLSTPLYFIWRTANPVRHWSYVGASGALTAIAGLYLGIASGTVPAPQAWLAPLSVVMVAALALFLIVYLADFYINVDELAGDKAYTMFGRAPLAMLMLLSAITALWLVTMAWHAIDPAILTERTITWHLFTPRDPLHSFDVLLFAADQAAKAILFDVFEVYQIGLTSLSNDPAHLAFSSLCFAYRTALQAFVTVVAVRLLLAPRTEKAAA